MPYAFSRTITDVLCEIGLSRTWCQSGEFVLECEKGYLSTRIRIQVDSDTCAEINPSRTPTNTICI